MHDFLFVRHCKYTGWLKLKYPTGQNAISRQPCEIFIPKLHGLYGRDPATILKLLRNYLSFLQSFGYINSLCHIFNFARNNQQQIVIFIHVMVSAGVCFGGKGRLHLIPNKTKVNAKLYVETLLPELVQDCRSVLPSGFIFQQDGAPAHTRLIKLAQDWTATNCSEFIGKDEWPSNSPDLNPLDYHVWGAMLERYKSFQPSRRTSMSIRKFCSWYGTSCHKTRSTKPYWACRKTWACVKADGGHFEHTLKWTTSYWYF